MLEQKAHATRLRKGHALPTPGQEPDSSGKAHVKAVTAGAPRVHVHLLMHMQVNRVMIRVS
ncbi:hypothetical protein GCM10010503_43150 [Streptomyces lucensis JCM 4490]|uniref:Uncharacterized protein n=1 Tax=Streptomyces lucensis JCM 4490 TaxID=1306176 RepID=A0A918J9V8_9ACTN|nr:hypothetical protein GCM10010503_43150 [Streptomyces lucensis JCM 4490]